MDLDLARELYFRELDGKAQQDTRLGVYVALLSVIGGALAVLTKWAWPPDSTLCYVGLAFSVIAVVLYVLSVCVLLGEVGLDWEKLPTPDELLAYRRKLDAYYESNPDDLGSASSDFDDYLLRHLASAATHNSITNLTRSATFYRAGVLLLAVVILTAISVAALGINQALLDLF